MEFEWDPKKAQSNERKHGVDFHEAETVVGDPLAITFSDRDHSEDEVRHLAFGLSRVDRLLVVLHVVRGGAAFSLGNLSFLEPNAINTSGLIAH